MPKPVDDSVERESLRELCERYTDDWLLVEILDVTAPAGDEPCVLLAHGPSRAAMFKAERKARIRDPRACLAIEGGATKFGTLEPLRQAIARIASGEDEWVSVNSW